MADDKYKLEKTRVADFVADSMHKIANHSSEAEGIHKQADYARKIASTRIVNVGTKAVLRPPFEVDGQWYYETKNLVGVETHGPFASAAEALKDIAGNIGGTKKAFELRWAKDREARFHPEGEWQLRFFEA